MARSLEKRRGETNESLLISLYAGFPMPRIVDRCTPFPCRLAGWEARYNRGSGAHVVAARLNTITGKPSPKVEIYHFCDALFARELLDYSLEFVVLMPCRIAVVEVSQQKIGLTMLDWDVRWTERVEQSPTARVEGSVLLRRTTFFCNAYHRAQTETACSSLPSAAKSITERTRTHASNAPTQTCSAFLAAQPGGALMRAAAIPGRVSSHAGRGVGKRQRHQPRA